MINVEEISQIVNKRNRMKKETYVELYKQITRKVRRAVETGRKYVDTEIPSFLMGYIAYDRLQATNYIKRQLENAGFDVDVMGHFEIRITWKVKKNNRTSENGIDSIDEFPTLINLKKAANRYRRNAENN
jgi:hypothetical protein|tara:strand:- start:92 stop:481 length:390 start_codon:yes stop_codon:yes gene_type:complete